MNAALTTQEPPKPITKEDLRELMGIDLQRETDRLLAREGSHHCQVGEKPATAPAETNPVKVLEAFEMPQSYVDRLGAEEYLHPNLAIRNHILTVIAMPNGGKTTIFYYYICPSLTQKGLTVWYVDLDSPPSDHKRMKATADEHGFKILNPDSQPGQSIEGLMDALKQIADSDADLSNWVLVVDTLKKIANLMSKDSVKAVYKLARTLTARGATVILLGHANKYRDKEGNLVFEGTGDVRADSDELIFFERTTNPNEGIDVTTVVDPDKGAKVRGLFDPISFHISEDREVTAYATPLPTIDFTATATPKATDDDIVDAARKYLAERNEPVPQRPLVQHVADVTATGEKRVRQVIARHAEPRDAPTLKGLPFRYTVGLKNTHYFEAARQ